MRDERDGMLPALRALGDSLGEAARREIGPATAGGRGEAGGPRTHQRWGRHGRITGIVAGVALVAAGAATAGDLISTGEPARAPQALPADVRPAPGPGEPIALRASDPEAGGAWGLRTYTSAAGHSCVVAGWVRGNALGVVDGGTFRAYPSDDPGRAGACASEPAPGNVGATVVDVSEPAPRTLVFGQAGEGVRRVAVDDGEARHVARVSGGIYLIVLAGVRDARDVQVSAGG